MCNRLSVFQGTFLMWNVAISVTVPIKGSRGQ